MSRTVLPSGPRRDNRTELSPIEALVEFGKRNPTVTGFAIGSVAPGVGNLTLAGIGFVGSRAISDWREMKFEARATYHERKANRFSEAGNSRRAQQAEKDAQHWRRRIAAM